VLVIIWATIVLASRHFLCHDDAVAPELIIRRRRIGPDDLQRIRELVVEEGERGRTHLSRHLCRAWDWRQANGRFREIACRDLLRQLEARGLIQLPAMLRPARRPGYQNPVRAPKLPEPTPPPGALKDWSHRIELNLVQSPAQRQLFNGLIGTCHYLGHRQPTGAQLQYLASYEQGPLAALSFGPAAFQVAARDQFIGWSAAQRQARLPWVVNNHRFLILPWAPVPQLASWVLSHSLRRLRRDWQEVYRQDLALCETFVEQERFAGSSYAAANWIGVGSTCGRGRNDRLNQAGLPVKTIWLYPLRPDFRRVLCAPLL
jgi:hypothetical protein